MDDALRVDLWNLILDVYADLKEESRWGDASPFLQDLWANFLRRPLDERQNFDRIRETLKQAVLKGPWYSVYDLVEYLASEVEARQTDSLYELTIRLFNGILERNLAGYRFASGRITPIDSEIDISAIEDALSDSAGMSGVQHHLQRALSLLADRQAPDYSNSIKESISAVESVCALITNERTLGAALKRLKDSGLTIHSALESAWSRLYGYTSDADGIRHFATEVPSVDQAQAKYFLVTCSAFVSLLIAEAARAGVSLDGT
jgi:hypothetical protein